MILIFIIALGLIFYAATVNLSRLSFSKILTVKAANLMASRLASYLASWGQMMSETYLGAGRETCKRAASWFDVIILAPIASIYEFAGVELTGDSAMPLSEYLPSYSRVFIVPQKVADMFNREASRMSADGQFMEGGIQAGLFSVVTDPIGIPDLTDLDADRIFGMTLGGEPNDKVSRFGYYYQERMKQIQPPNTEAIQVFLDALTEMWSVGNDRWALMDPLRCVTDSTHPCCRSDRYDVSTGQARLDFPAECDPCCQPLGDRPACCDYAVGYDADLDGTPDNCGAPDSCTVRSLYYADDENSPDNYRYVYQPFSYENSLNSFLSFREMLGRDDEHHRYHPRQLEPNTHLFIPAGRQYFDAPLATDNEFILQDASGYYRRGTSAGVTPPPGTSFFALPQVQDRMSGIFPFFYKTQNPGWGVELNTLTYTDDQCHWCDPLGDGAAQGAPASCSGSPAPYLPPEIPRLNLGVTALGTYSGGWCVDRVNTGTYPIVLDRVDSLPASLFAAPDACAQTIPETGNPGGGWKSGADRFCSPIITIPTPGPQFPYEQGCEKHGYGTACTDAGGNSVDCLCGEAGAGAATPDIATGYMGWVDDNLDDIIYGLPAFWAVSLPLLGGDAMTLTQTMADDWYPRIADWIEPACPANAGNACNTDFTITCPDACANSFTDLAREGVLWTWLSNLESFHDPIYAWVFPPAGSEYEGTSCTNLGGPVQDVWCVPPPTVTPNNYGINECAYVQPAEAATFNVNANGIRGDLEDVVACLNWNANDTRTYVGGAPPATGNAEKFQRCGDAATCSSETCSQLPRCLVPAFYAPWPPFVNPTDPNYPLFVTCRDSATVDQCSANCSQPVPLPSGPPYNLPAWFPPDLAQIAAFDATVANFFANTCTIDPFAIITICDADNAGGTDLNCGSTAGEVSACKCSWYNSCAGFPSPAGCGGDATYYNAVANAANTAGGSCSQTGPAQFIGVVRQCEAEARIQVPKMRKRYYFLNNRLQEAMSMVNPALDASGNPIGILSGAIARLTAFLYNGTPWGTAGSPNPPYTQDSPAENLIDVQDDASINSTLPSVAVYVWQDDLLKKPRTDGSYLGYWHAVKVEARMPKRCNSRCGPGGGGDPSTWPNIRAYARGKWYNREICYVMNNTEGMVKARVIRYDEDQDPQSVFFPGGEKIWESRNYHPAVGRGNPTMIATRCQPQIDGTLFTMGYPYANAFMLNRSPTPQERIDNANYWQCWQEVHINMLQYGVSTEACAQYTWGGGSPGVGGDGMRVKFVPCDGDFLSGAN